MSVQSQQSRIQYVVTSKGQTLTVPWYFLESGHVGVVRGKGAGETRLVLNTHYTVNGEGNQSGGSIKLTTDAAEVGDVITLFRDGPFTQPNDYPLAGQFPAATIEETDDASTMIDQQLRNQTERSLRVSIAEEPIAPIKGGLQPNGVIGVDENGNPVSWHKDDFKGDKGDKGDDGKDGVDGIDGKDGADGKDGTDGANAMVYWLELDAACFLKHEDGTFNPEKAYVRALKRESDGPTEWMGECALRIEQLVNGAWVNDWQSANWHGSNYGNRAPLPDSVAVRFSLYKAGSFSELLDAKILPVSPSGALGNGGGGGGGNPQPPQPPPPPPPPAPPDTYELELSHSNLSRNADWSFAEPNLVVAAWRYPQGTGPKVAYAGRFEIHLGHTGGNYNPHYTSISDETTQSVQTATGWGHDLNSIRVRLYAAGGLTTLLDEQVCTVTNAPPPPPSEFSIELSPAIFQLVQGTGGSAKLAPNTVTVHAYRTVNGSKLPYTGWLEVYAKNKDGSYSPIYNSANAESTRSVNLGGFLSTPVSFDWEAIRFRLYAYDDDAFNDPLVTKVAQVLEEPHVILTLEPFPPVGEGGLAPNPENLVWVTGGESPYNYFVKISNTPEGGGKWKVMGNAAAYIKASPHAYVNTDDNQLSFVKFMYADLDYPIMTGSDGLSSAIFMSSSNKTIQARYLP